MTTQRIIDTHQHVFWHSRNDADLVADMDENNIERAWVLTWEVAPEEDARMFHKALNPVSIRDSGTHAGIELEDILRTRDRYPDRFDAGYCPHPLQPCAPGLLYAAAHMHDVKVCGEWKFRVLIDDPRCLELFKVAGELGMPVVLHLDVPFLLEKDGQTRYDANWYGGTVDNLERALQACPDTNFIGHAPGFWREICGAAASAPTAYPKDPIVPGGKLYRLLDTYPNLYADLSAGSGLYALRRDETHAPVFINRFAHKLVFGRDYYGGELQQFLATIALTDSTKEQIYFKNAEMLLSKRQALTKPPINTIWK